MVVVFCPAAEIASVGGQSDVQPGLAPCRPCALAGLALVCGGDWRAAG